VYNKLYSLANPEANFGISECCFFTIIDVFSKYLGCIMSTRTKKSCDNCGAETECYLNPLPTVDIIIELDNQGVLLIKRKNTPFGWAIPGGFVDYGESLEDAAVREAKEETGLDIKLIRQLHTYSRPDRDPRHHAISTVYIATAIGRPCAADDAVEVGIFTRDTLPSPLVFDHKEILTDYFTLKEK
jgi:ADP-ribose pyrophosphatase YjhB (NUDIX family)